MKRKSKIISDIDFLEMGIKRVMSHYVSGSFGVRTTQPRRSSSGVVAPPPLFTRGSLNMYATRYESETNY